MSTAMRAEGACQQGQDDVIDDVLGEGVVEPLCGRHLAVDLGLDHLVHQARELPGGAGGQFPARYRAVHAVVAAPRFDGPKILAADRRTC